MKKLFQLSVNIFVVIFCLISCEENQSKNDKLFDELKKEHIISRTQGISMYSEFQENRSDLVQPQLRNLYKDSTFVDTKFVWFSLEDVKTYLSYIEAIQKDNPDKAISGIRIYFGAYPNSTRFHGKPIINPRQQSLFMIPTVSVGNLNDTYNTLNHLPFVIQADSNEKNSFKGEFKIVEELMLDFEISDRLKRYNSLGANQKAGFGIDVSPVFETSEISTIFNEGEMAPPPIKEN